MFIHFFYECLHTQHKRTHYLYCIAVEDEIRLKFSCDMSTKSAKVVSLLNTRIIKDRFSLLNVFSQNV